MARFALNKTKITPAVILDEQNGLIELSGRSLPENTSMFYTPVLDWIDQYVKKPNSDTTVNLKFEYFDSSTSRCLVDMFRKFEGIKQGGRKLKINWFYEEEDEMMLRSGEDYCQMTGIEMDFVPVDEIN